ncbi:MAG TPA: oxygen-dependent coproporphyrinogen oxidase [Gemmatimonas aurantiaca]|uniref:coproporphyrinogen oxidase n=2 Tax=Gemmatimonas aurantiaca TaxID=173480 RepID=C1A7G8_GEMAT|nr:oxygen-dependent coproporphyrinogen oxidase [Gemmatimonas aurantiaca]BAH38178.1 coproporphyrinogen III oxidase [Gemmatimonas aurantiaca T-27]HCT56951.1 oxygen-dependent coproporphyrinogen oxidase [Gemmatimonas aurantiaca]
MSPESGSSVSDLRRHQIASRMEGLHDELTAFFTRLDEGGTFREDRWERPGGGGGVARVLSDGITFEKAGINRSVVMGVLPDAAAQRLGGVGAATGTTHFFATGVSLVVHPRSPMIPTVHLNVRYFELTDEQGTLTDSWFGGGTDLTPFYPHEDDAHTFHRGLGAMCDRHHATFYDHFKAWCDRYFVNTHRGNEARGVGGIFFDHLRANDPAHGLDAEAVALFVSDVARVLPAAYEPIVTRRRDTTYGEPERTFQLVRRGRYVEFNLVHDRGTTFGLQTNARVESVLMSLPPLAMWQYAPEYAEGSFEARLIAMLAPRDWR